MTLRLSGKFSALRTLAVPCGLAFLAAVLPWNANAADILQSASGFAVLAGSTVTNTGPTVITGDVGVSPGTAITGFPPGTVVGSIDSNNTAAIQAEVDLGSAYSYLSGLDFNTDLTGQDLGGQTLTAGVYKFDSSAALTGALTLSGPGDFIFQIGSTLTTASDASIVTSAGANASDIYFQVGSSATVGTDSALQGNIVALQSITMTTGATLTGRALAINGAVTMDTNTITAPSSTPEPGTVMLFGLSMIGMAILTSRRASSLRFRLPRAKAHSTS